MTAITETRFARKVESVIRHYFDSDVNTCFDDENNIALMGLWALFGSIILAFLTIGISTSQGEYFVSTAIFMIGIGVFMASAVVHFLMFVFGSFYKYGIFHSIGTALMVIAFAVAYAIGFIVGTLGGFFLSIMAFTALPSFGVLLPLKIIIFAVPSIWWFGKGWSIMVEWNSLRDTFERELDWLAGHGIEI